MAYPLHVRILRFCLLLVLASLALVIPSVAQRTKPIFEQDLQSYGYKFQYARDDRMQSFTDLAFLSDDLVLVSVKELYLDELHPKILPSGTIMYDNPMGARTPPTSLSTLLLFSLDQKKLVRSAKLPIRKMDGAVQATQNGHFLMLSSYGLHLCSAQLECGPPWPTEGPVYISPQGIRAVVGGSRWSEQQLVDVDKFAVRETFKSGPPTVIPGDVGLMLVGYQNTLVRMPGRKDLDVGFGGDVVSPRSRFLDHDKVIGIKMSGISEGKATATKVDGTVLYQIEVKDAWRHNVQL